MLYRRREESTGGEERKMCIGSNRPMYEGEGTSGCCKLGMIIPKLCVSSWPNAED